MSYSDETLGAYVDGELEAQARAAIEAAMDSDPEIARRIERLRVLRNELLAAFSGATQEPVPRRLLDLLRSEPDPQAESAPPPGSARLANMAKARAAKANAPRRHWARREWSALAASLVTGVLLGYFFLRSPGTESLRMRPGGLLAHGDLAHALSGELASEQARDAAVRVGLTFRDTSGGYCRTFALRRGRNIAGLACRENAGWRVQVLARNEFESGGGAEPAGTALPAAVLGAIKDRISGEPLDAAAEAAARQSNWGVP